MAGLLEAALSKAIEQMSDQNAYLLAARASHGLKGGFGAWPWKIPSVKIEIPSLPIPSLPDLLEDVVGDGSGDSITTRIMNKVKEKVSDLADRATENIPGPGGEIIAELMKRGADLGLDEIQDRAELAEAIARLGVSGGKQLGYFTRMLKLDEEQDPDKLKANLNLILSAGEIIGARAPIPVPKFLRQPLVGSTRVGFVSSSVKL